MKTVVARDACKITSLHTAGIRCTALMFVCVALSGCVTASSIPGDDVDSARGKMLKGCGYYADAEPIRVILAKGIPYLSTVDAIVGAVCNSVRRSAAGGLVAPPIVGGVPVTGHF